MNSISATDVNVKAQAMRQGPCHRGGVSLCPRRRRRRRCRVAASTSALLLWTSSLLPQHQAGTAAAASFCPVASSSPPNSSKVVVPRRSDGYGGVAFAPRRTSRLSATGGAGFGKKAGPVAPSRQQASPGERPGAGGHSEDGGGGSSSSSSSSSPPSSSFHGREIYSKPSLYDLAFGYRDYDEEVAFLLGAHARHSRGGVDDAGGPHGEGLRVLELAAGPARHSLAALAATTAVPVRRATAVDVSGEMMEYGLDLARERRGRAGEGGSLRIVNDDDEDGCDDEFSGGRGGGATFEYVLQDMRHLDLMTSKNAATPPLYDSAWMLLGSMQHLLTNDDVVSCLSSLHRHLSPEGTVVIELPHPAEAVFNALGCTKNSWVVPLDLSSGGDGDGDGSGGAGDGGVAEETGTLKVLWGDANDPFDPVRQVRQFSVGLELTTTMTSTAATEEKSGQRRGKKSKKNTKRKAGERTSVREVVPLRVFTAQEVDALARCAGFEVAKMYGALDADVGVDETDDEQAYRMVCVLRKRL